MTHVCILYTYHCGKELCEAFKRRGSSKYVLFCRDYTEIVVANFSVKIQYEYYGDNTYVSIEGITLENLGAT